MHSLFRWLGAQLCAYYGKTIINNFLAPLFLYPDSFPFSCCMYIIFFIQFLCALPTLYTFLFIYRPVSCLSSTISYVLMWCYFLCECIAYSFHHSTFIHVRTIPIILQGLHNDFLAWMVRALNPYPRSRYRSPVNVINSLLASDILDQYRVISYPVVESIVVRWVSANACSSAFEPNLILKVSIAHFLNNPLPERKNSHSLAKHGHSVLLCHTKNDTFKLYFDYLASLQNRSPLLQIAPIGFLGVVTFCFCSWVPNTHQFFKYLIVSLFEIIPYLFVIRAFCTTLQTVTSTPLMERILFHRQ